jgi:hypothetical protein
MLRKVVNVVWHLLLLAMFVSSATSTYEVRNPDGTIGDHPFEVKLLLAAFLVGLVEVVGFALIYMTRDVFVLKDDEEVLEKSSVARIFNRTFPHVEKWDGGRMAGGCVSYVVLAILTILTIAIHGYLGPGWGGSDISLVVVSIVGAVVAFIGAIVLILFVLMLAANESPLSDSGGSSRAPSSVDYPTGWIKLPGDED